MVTPTTDTPETTADAPEVSVPEVEAKAPEVQEPITPEVVSTPEAQPEPAPVEPQPSPAVVPNAPEQTPQQLSERQELDQQKALVQNYLDTIRFAQAEQVMAQDLVSKGGSESDALAEAKRARQEYERIVDSENRIGQQREYLNQRFQGSLQLAQRYGIDANYLYNSQARDFVQMEAIAKERSEVAQLRSEVSSLKQDRVQPQEFSDGQGSATDSDDEFMRNYGTANPGDQYSTPAAHTRAQKILSEQAS